jgi:NADPH-dependent 7-cyano-7-deazaguanine reductase QueF-like protein
MFLKTSHIQTKTTQPKYDAQTLVASKLLKLYLNCLWLKLIDNLFKSLEN